MNARRHISSTDKVCRRFWTVQLKLRERLKITMRRCSYIVVMAGIVPRRYRPHVLAECCLPLKCFVFMQVRSVVHKMVTFAPLPWSWIWCILFPLVAYLQEARFIWVLWSIHLGPYLITWNLHHPNYCYDPGIKYESFYCGVFSRKDSFSFLVAFWQHSFNNSNPEICCGL